VLVANLPRRYISELHGNFFLDECTACKGRFIRAEPAKTMRLQKSSKRCPREKCRGFIRDCILDWHSKIPHLELRRSQKASKLHLHILIGSTAQLVPAKTLINSSKKGKKYKLVVINLQPTQFDKEADLVIHNYADDVMKLLAEELGLLVPAYDSHEDPTKTSAGAEWKRT
jgi:mono-ADP-ribosyltransferase sirtuin 6